MDVSEFLQTPWGIGFTSSIAAAIVLVVFRPWRWWRKKKLPASVELATQVLKFLEGDGDTNTRQMISNSKQLSDSLIASYQTKTAHDEQVERTTLMLINKILEPLKPLAAELTAADKELDNLKRAAMAFQKSLEDRERTIRHLAKVAPDPGHVRAQLVAVNTEPDDFLKAAKGEAAIFLRGYGIGRLARFRYFRQKVKKHWPVFKESVSKEYRLVLQETSLHKAKK